MPVSSKAKLAYQKTYNAKPENVNRRELNNSARREAIRDGKARVGDGKDVDHIKPLDNGGGNTKGNTRVVSEHTNRSWRKGQSGYNPGLQKK